LEFAFKKWSEVPESASKKELWALYDLLLEFYSHMDQTVLQLPEVEKNKKIPPKRDLRFSSTA